MNGIRIIPSHRDMSHVYDGDDYLGLLRELDGAFRVYGARMGVDGRLVDMEAEFESRDDAVDWLLDGDEGAADAEYDDGGAGS